MIYFELTILTSACQVYLIFVASVEGEDEDGGVVNIPSEEGR